jgi:hypothetical protein
LLYIRFFFLPCITHVLNHLMCSDVYSL